MFPHLDPGPPPKKNKIAKYTPGLINQKNDVMDLYCKKWIMICNQVVHL